MPRNAKYVFGGVCKGLFKLDTCYKVYYKSAGVLDSSG